MVNHTRAVIVGLVVLGLTTPQIAMAVDARSLMYAYAREGNVDGLRAMRARGYSFEMMDANGNTSLCEAALRQDKSAVDLLVSMGANPQPSCWQRLPADIAQEMEPDLMAAHVGMGSNEAWQNTGSNVVVSQPTRGGRPVVSKRPIVYAPTTKPIDWSIPSWVGWLGIAGISVGAAMAIASSGSSSHKEGGEASRCDGYDLSLKPVNAYYESCEYNGVTKYKMTGCFARYVLYEGVCTARKCASYTLTRCPDHGTCSSCTEYDGSVSLKLDSCESNYQISGTSCVEYKQSAKIGVNGYANLTENSPPPGTTSFYYLNNSISLESAIYQDIYGIRDNSASGSEKDISNAYSSKTAAGGNKTVSITHSNRGNDYGIYSTGSGTNAHSITGSAEIKGIITITKNISSGVKDSNIYGIMAQKAVNSLGEDRGRPTASQSSNNVTGQITITKKTNKDNTVAVGVSGITYATNAIKTSVNNLTSKGTISISHAGSGSITGVESTTNSTHQGYAYNALMTPNMDHSLIVTDSSDDLSDDAKNETEAMAGRAEAAITITNSSGSADIVGVDGYARAANAFKDFLPKTTNPGKGYIKGEITITNSNGDGDVYGLRSNGGSVYNMYNNRGSVDSVSTITITNGTIVNTDGSFDAAKSKASNGRVYGMFSAKSGSNGLISVGATADVTTASARKEDVIDITAYGTGETWGFYSSSLPTLLRHKRLIDARKF